MMLALLVFEPKFAPLWLSVLVFAISPLMTAARPRRSLRAAWCVVSLSLLFPWLLFLYHMAINTDRNARLMAGFYLWATASSLVWMAVVLPSPVHRAKKRRGFPVLPTGVEK
jgi:hypothetical protein